MENQEVIKEMFNRLVALKKDEVDYIYDIKTLEEDIKFDYASAKGYKKKDETIDVGQVKSPLVKEAIKIKLLEEKNKLEEKYNILCEYINDIENETFNMDLVKSYSDKLEEVDGIKNDYKLTKDEYSGVLEKDTIKSIDKLVKIVSDDYKKNKDREWKESMGKPVNDKEVKDDTVLKELAKILGIELEG